MSTLDGLHSGVSVWGGIFPIGAESGGPLSIPHSKILFVRLIRDFNSDERSGSNDKKGLRPDAVQEKMDYSNRRALFITTSME